MPKAAPPRRQAVGQRGIGYELRRAFMSLHRRLKKATATSGITPDQYIVLWVLNAHGAMIQKEIHERIDSDGNTVREILRRMVRKGWIRRTRRKGDARAVLVEITPKGEVCRQRVFSIARKLHHKALAGFTSRERDRLSEYLVRIFESLESTGEEG